MGPVNRTQTLDLHQRERKHSASISPRFTRDTSLPFCIERALDLSLGFVERSDETRVERPSNLSNSIEIIIGSKTNKQRQVFGVGCHPQKEGVSASLARKTGKTLRNGCRDLQEKPKKKESIRETHTSDTQRGQTGETGSMRLQPTTCATRATEHLNGRQCGQAGTREESWHTRGRQLDRPRRDVEKKQGKKRGRAA